MNFGEHLRTTATALKNWLVAQALDAAAVTVLWYIGLRVIGVPWAPLWALLGGLFQFVPHLGLTLALIGPALAAAFTGGWERLAWVLMLYAGIAMADGFLLQPYFMKRQARVPIWVSILAPVALGLLFSFWGVLLAPPLLAVVYAYRARARARLPAADRRMDATRRGS